MDGSPSSDNTALPRHGGEDGAGDVSSPHRVLDEVSGTFASARRVVSDFLELLALETRRAGLTLVWMVACGAAAAILAVTAWLGFMAALALWAVSIGFPWGAAVTVISLANLLAAAIMTSVCVRKSRDLLFTATRRQLEAKPARPEWL